MSYRIYRPFGLVFKLNIKPQTSIAVLSAGFSTLHISFDVHKSPSESLGHQRIKDWIENTIKVVEHS